ncbi:MAG: DUF2309 domain-containing protein, partial [Pirellulaceae bacterium]|nr:DUF2309 domain-containing protein [Pirellulaceae bacterium]
ARPHEAERLAAVAHWIEAASHLLPAQGPINVFIHHNTLHAFEDLTFDRGVQAGARRFGCQPYLSEDQYRQLLEKGRLRNSDIAAVVASDLGERAEELIGFMGTRYHLRLAMLEHPLRIAPAAELRWYIAETDALSRFRSESPSDVRKRMVASTKKWLDQLAASQSQAAALGQGRRDSGFAAAALALADQFGPRSLWSDATWEAFTLQILWRTCREGAHVLKGAAAERPTPVRPRDWLLEATGVDCDELVHSVLIRFCAAMLDQGLSHWPLPERDTGFWRAFSALFTQPLGAPDAWLAGLPRELTRQIDSQQSPLESILESLDSCGIAPQQAEEFITASLLALRGWAGMIHQLEARADRAALPAPQGSLTEFLAIRLILDRLAASYVAQRELQFVGPLTQLAQGISDRLPKHESVGLDQRAFLLFQLAQVRGWEPTALKQLSRQEWLQLLGELDAFHGIERRRTFQAALERSYRTATLDALATHARIPHLPEGAPSFQIVCCLDEREESFRRHLEEISPSVETYGAAGFFSVPMYFRGAAEAHYVPLCPIVVQPAHWVDEQPLQAAADQHQWRTSARRALGTASHRLHVSSRSFTFGAILSGAFGALATAPLVARVLFPRLTAKLWRSANQLFEAPEQTELRLVRQEPTDDAAVQPVGFSLEEMTDMVERLLVDIGLREFSRLVVILGHGSHSLNNPHNSAYNCGACGGNAGGPNARALAQMANLREVRARLSTRGIVIPDSTWFLGGIHNTCNDDVTWFDLQSVPSTHAGDLEIARAAIREAGARNAHERCRRFASAPLDMSPQLAKRHVEARAEDLAQVRPECGHATNAVAFVGRRKRTRGLFMDRRTFLTSYDPAGDDESGAILTRILAAVVPVCGGINLEYYFSYVDPTGYGCGTKLPHNVTSLLGVMDGPASDLRTGLPWQMVEIHEPVRLLIVAESTPAIVARVLAANPGIARPCLNGWVQLATLAPDSDQIHLLVGDRFIPYQPESTELPEARSSADWYRGQRDHLPYAAIKL